MIELHDSSSSESDEGTSDNICLPSVVCTRDVRSTGYAPRGHVAHVATSGRGKKFFKNAPVGGSRALLDTRAAGAGKQRS